MAAFDQPGIAPQLIVGFGFGASFVALFAQLGGGIYTKAADMGADLVGKVEAGIPEDDPRNAAVIADLVGDNVGDCAGRGADLFESTAAESIGAMILATIIYAATKDIGWILFPLVVRGFGILASMVGILSVRPRNEENPMNALNRGYFVSIGAQRRRAAAGCAHHAAQLVAVLGRPGGDYRQYRRRLHHPVLHRRPLPPGEVDYQCFLDRFGHQYRGWHRGWF